MNVSTIYPFGSTQLLVRRLTWPGLMASQSLRSPDLCWSSRQARENTEMK